MSTGYSISFDFNLFDGFSISQYSTGNILKDLIIIILSILHIVCILWVIVMATKSNKKSNTTTYPTD